MENICTLLGLYAIECMVLCLFFDLSRETILESNQKSELHLIHRSVHWPFYWIGNFNSIQFYKEIMRYTVSLLRDFFPFLNWNSIRIYSINHISWFLFPSFIIYVSIQFFARINKKNIRLCQNGNAFMMRWMNKET